jgi:hypothetical protein
VKFLYKTGSIYFDRCSAGALEAQGTSMDDTALMHEALLEAQAAYDRGECAVGAVLVQNGQKTGRLLRARGTERRSCTIPRPMPRF